MQATLVSRSPASLFATTFRVTLFASSPNERLVRVSLPAESPLATFSLVFFFSTTRARDIRTHAQNTESLRSFFSSSSLTHKLGALSLPEPLPESRLPSLVPLHRRHLHLPQAAKVLLRHLESADVHHQGVLPGKDSPPDTCTKWHAGMRDAHLLMDLNHSVG